MTALATVIGRDTFANRPAASIAGRLFHASDTNVLYRDNGSSWDQIATSATGLTDPTTTRGDLLARGASAVGRLAIGTVGQLLSTDGTDPIWAHPSAQPYASSTVTGSDAASIDFSSIPATGKHMRIVIVGRLDTAASEDDWFYLKMNGDAGSNYARTQIIGSNGANPIGSSTGALSAPGSPSLGAYLPAASANASRAGQAEILIVGYSLTNWHKQYTAIGGYTDNASNNRISITQGVWASTAAINEVTLLAEGSQKFKVNTVVFIYL